MEAGQQLGCLTCECIWSDTIQSAASGPEGGSQDRM